MTGAQRQVVGRDVHSHPLLSYDRVPSGREKGVVNEARWQAAANQVVLHGQWERTAVDDVRYEHPLRFALPPFDLVRRKGSGPTASECPLPKNATQLLTRSSLYGGINLN